MRRAFFRYESKFLSMWRCMAPRRFIYSRDGQFDYHLSRPEIDNLVNWTSLRYLQLPVVSSISIDVLLPLTQLETLIVEEGLHINRTLEKFTSLTELHLSSVLVWDIAAVPPLSLIELALTFPHKNQDQLAMHHIHRSFTRCKHLTRVRLFHCMEIYMDYLRECVEAWPTTDRIHS